MTTNQTQGAGQAQITIQGDQQTKHSLGQQLAEFLRGRGHKVEMGGALKTAQTPSSATGQSFEVNISDEPQPGFSSSQTSQQGQQPQT